MMIGLVILSKQAMIIASISAVCTCWGMQLAYWMGYRQGKQDGASDVSDREIQNNNLQLK